MNALEMLQEKQASLNREAVELERRMCAAYRRDSRSRDWEADRPRYIALRDELAVMHFDALEMSGRNIADIREGCLKEWRAAARNWTPRDAIRYEPTPPQGKIRYHYTREGLTASRVYPSAPAAGPPRDEDFGDETTVRATPPRPHQIQDATTPCPFVGTD